jgi:tRNA(Arg) A34 adenosine deaminase TadA
MADASRYLELASHFTQRRKGDGRKFMIGAVGIRSDGAIVTARNSPSADVTPGAHAESRLCNRLTPNSIVFVVRVTKTGTWAMAKPCKACEIKLRAAGVKNVYYTNDQGEVEHLSL